MATATRKQHRLTTHDFIAQHRNQGHVVETDCASIPNCWTCQVIYVVGCVLRFETDDAVEVR